MAQLRLQSHRWSLFYPVWLALGIGFYFMLPIEPGLAVFIAVTLIFLLCSWLIYFGRVSQLLIILCLVAGGFIIAKIRVEMLATKTLAASTGTTEFTGWIEATSRYGERRTRYYINIDTAKGIKPESLPHTVRITGKRSRQLLLHGDEVKFTARLYPLPTPVAPDMFNFGRKLWFENIGATGFILGEITATGKVHATGITGSLKRIIQKTRNIISERIYRTLSRQTAGIAIALITGERGLLTKDTKLMLQTAGLAHILAISGLHMSLVAGGMFWLVRALLALSPFMAVHRPIKKWAAIAGIITGLFYLAISGFGISTQRSFIMLTIMFLSILVNRQALSLRNVAIAAAVICLLRPETVLSAGFQMSFMAVIGLTGFYEAWRLWKADRAVESIRSSKLLHIPKKLLGYFAAIAATTFIASLYTTVPAMYHFGRIAPYGLAGNLVALPIVSLIIMPMAILSVLLMPLGLEYIPLQIMGWGIDLVLKAAAIVSSWHGANAAIGHTGEIFALLMSAGLIWFSLWQKSLKLFGFIFILAALPFLAARPGPDIFVGKFARNAAFRNEAGQLVAVDKRRSRFSVEQWLSANGEKTRLSASAKRPGWKCKAKICTANVKNWKIAYLYDGARLEVVKCPDFDIVIAAFPLRGKCKPGHMAIDRFDVWSKGAHAIYLDGANIEIRTTMNEHQWRAWDTIPVARRTILINPGAKGK